VEILLKESYRGIDYIRIQSLPLAQSSLFRAWLTPSHIINIQVNEEILRDCVLFKHYEEWLSTLGIVEPAGASSVLTAKQAASAAPIYTKVAAQS
jgi:hypothetical protein